VSGESAPGLDGVSRETAEQLKQYSRLLEGEAAVQNLVSASTIENLWQRHILDSAQLARFSKAGASWIDIGSGAGLPGVVIAIITGDSILLAEPRRLRAEFLSRVVSDLRLTNAQVAMAKAERVQGRFDVITARAVAPLSKLLGITAHLAHPGTMWVLPKGRSAKSELAEAELSWHYDARAEPSCTDPESSILLLSNVRAKSKR
jgi:16S rRNA (guanine527-N7)-methyltransferase